MVDFNKRVTANADDGRARTSGADWQPNATDGILGIAAIFVYHNFVRFTNVTIPKGAVINSAVIRLEANTTTSGTGDRTNIHFEAADNPSAPTSGSDLVGRSLGSAVAWDDVGNWTAGNTYDTPDLTTILQAVIDRTGWASGNAIQAHLVDDGSSGTTRYFKSHNNDSAAAAELRVTYTADPNVSVNELVGVEENISVELDELIEPSTVENVGVTENVQIEIDEITQFVVDENIGAEENIQVDLEILPEAQATEQIGLTESITMNLPVAPVSFSASESLQITENISIELDIPPDWVALANLGLAIERFYFTLTGDADSTTDVEISMANFNGRKRTGEQTYLQVVLKDFDNNSSLVSARPNGTMIIEMNYVYGSDSSKRQEIIRAELEEINLYEGGDNKSITLVGRETKTFINRSVTMENPTFKSTVGGRRTFRFARVDPYLNPGDTLVVGAVSLTVDYITYTVGSGSKAMQVKEI